MSSPSPRYEWRGFMLDTARHFFEKDAIKRCLDRMAECGLNVFHWHLTDDQGWRLALPEFPELARYGSVRPCSPPRGEDDGSDGTPYGPFFYTPEDAREVVGHAAALGIEVVPEIETPGHSRALLAAYPHLVCEGVEVDRNPLCAYGICDDIICAGNDEAIETYERILDAVLEIFPGKFIHIGGDEAPKKNWKACPRCQARMKAEGLADEEALQSWITTRVAKHLAAKGRRTVGWDEILSGGDLPEGTVVQCWRGDGGAAAVNAAKRGLDVIMSPSRFTYLSIPEGLPGDPYFYRKCTMNSGVKLPKEKIAEFDPCADIPAELRGRILGGECCAWSEEIHGEEELRYKTFGRMEVFAKTLI